MQDLRLVVRALRATPVVTGVAVLSLALGIGASTAIFSLVASLLPRPLPVAEPDRLVTLASDPASPEARIGTRPLIKSGSMESYSTAHWLHLLLGRNSLTISGETERVGRAFDVALPIKTQPLTEPATPLDNDLVWLSIMLRLKPVQSLDGAPSPFGFVSDYRL